MTTKHVYLSLAVIGLVIPYSFFISFLLSHGPDGSEFLRQLVGTPLSAFFVADLLISCVVFLSFIRQESARYAMRNRWIYVVALVTVGLSFALPLFLFVRQQHIETGVRVIEAR
jgi:hypothetical protein